MRWLVRAVLDERSERGQAGCRRLKRGAVDEDGSWRSVGRGEEEGGEEDPSPAGGVAGVFREKCCDLVFCLVQAEWR